MISLFLFANRYTHETGIQSPDTIGMPDFSLHHSPQFAR
jgi:hypothetical protein